MINSHMQDIPRKKISFHNLDLVLMHHRQWLDSKGRLGKRAELKGIDLSGRELFGVILTGAVLEGCDVTRANLQFAEVSNATIADVDFSGAFFHNVKISSMLKAFSAYSHTPIYSGSKI